MTDYLIITFLALIILAFSIVFTYIGFSKEPNRKKGKYSNLHIETHLVSKDEVVYLVANKFDTLITNTPLLIKYPIMLSDEDTTVYNQNLGTITEIDVYYNCVLTPVSPEFGLLGIVDKVNLCLLGITVHTDTRYNGEPLEEGMAEIIFHIKN